MAILGDVLDFILWLHRHDIAVGDLHLENILLTRTPPPRVHRMPVMTSSSSGPRFALVGRQAALPKQEPDIMECGFGPMTRSLPRPTWANSL